MTAGFAAAPSFLATSGRSGDRMTAFLRLVMLGAVVSTAAACVTINIYFPAAAAEKAADRIIEDVWQLREGAAPAERPATNGEAK